jgi:AraC-like DNA-binding protein
MAVGAVHRDRYRNTVRFGQQAAFDAAFAAIRRIGARFFPLPAAPSSLHRPSPATTNQSHRAHRAPATPGARTLQIPRPGPTGAVPRAHRKAGLPAEKGPDFRGLPAVDLEPFEDEEKAVILRFIATNYTNSGLDLEGAAAGTGAKRNKINEVLKAELGMTFTSYVNKLRLTEAARLLTDKAGATVAEIAHSVGYANGTYFIKLFKEEYGWPLKAFRNLATKSETPSARNPAGSSNQSAEDVARP